MDENSMPEIYIGNLPSNIDEKSLEAAFSLCGKIVQEKTLVVNYRNLGVLRAYGFITFEDPASVKRAQGFIKSVLVDEKEHIGYPLVIYPAMEYRYRAEIAILEAVSEQEIINEIRKSYGWSFHECIQYKNRGNSVLVCVDFKSEQARQKFIRLGLRFQSEPATVRDHPKRTASIPRQQRPFTLYMCNIPPNTTEQDLRDMFKLCGPIETITIENVESYLKRGSIVFMTKQGSELAESFNGSLVNNWPVPIKLYRPCLGKYDAEADFPYGVRVRYFGSNVTLGDIEIKLCPSQIGSVKGVRPKDWESLGYLYVNFKNRELQEKALAMSGKLDLGGDRPAEFEPTERWVQSTVLVDDASHVRESIPQREFSQAQLNHSRKPTNNLHDRFYSVNNVFSRYCQVYTLQSDRHSLLETHKMQLTQNMRLDAVLPLLQAAGAIPDTVLETIKRYHGLQARRELLKAVEDHGDDAFESLYESFVSSKQYSLAALLQPLIKDDSNNVDPHHSLTPNSNQYSWIDKMPMELTGRLNLPVEGTDGLSVKNQLQIWRNNSSNIYKNFSSPKGRCLIINNHRFATMGDRKGTEIDSINAQKLFRELGYEVVIHNDLKAKAMIHELYIFSQNRDHGDSLIVLILTHGDARTFKGTDGEPAHIDSILSMFNGQNAPHLADKPKIFLFQACRGESYDDGVYLNEKGITGADAVSIVSVVHKMGAPGQHLPSETDFFIGYATAPGYVAFRNEKKGTWFIQAICEIFSRHAKEADICELMTLVNRRISDGQVTEENQKQTPDWSNRLRKKFYFFPGVNRPF